MYLDRLNFRLVFSIANIDTVMDGDPVFTRANDGTFFRWEKKTIGYRPFLTGRRGMDGEPLIIQSPQMVFVEQIEKAPAAGEGNQGLRWGIAHGDVIT